MAAKVMERRKRLLEVLEKEPCSIEQMAVILNTSRRTLETDIKELRKEGNEISVQKDVISLKQKKEVIVRSTPAIARQVKINAPRLYSPSYNLPNNGFANNKINEITKL